MTDIRERHVDQNSLCGWCCCDWPCDAIREADRADAAEAELVHAEATGERMAGWLADEQARADKAEAALLALPEHITRWMMGAGMTIVHRWMTTGWRETMYDEGVAMWADFLTAHKEAVK